VIIAHAHQLKAHWSRSTSRPDYVLVPTDMATMAASLNDLTDSLPIRRGETWLCESGDDSNSIQCRLVDAERQRSRAWRFADPDDLTCVLIEAEDYQPNLSERPLVDILDFTQITLPKGASFALTCVEAGRRHPPTPWQCTEANIDMDRHRHGCQSRRPSIRS
jgi:hypothetical protein